MRRFTIKSSKKSLARTLIELVKQRSRRVHQAIGFRISHA